MGFWGVLLELARAVVPHAAPHVARAVVDAAKQRRDTVGAPRPQPANQPSNESLAAAISSLAERLSAAENRAAAAEERFAEAQTQAARRWDSARKIFIGLIVWNGAVTAALIALLIYVLVRH